MSCVLVVDDDQGVRDSLDALLSPSYCVHTAPTGREAMKLLQQYPIAGIVLDVVLDNEDGLALLPEVRKVSAAPVLVLTGHCSEELLIRRRSTDTCGSRSIPGT